MLFGRRVQFGAWRRRSARNLRRWRWLSRLCQAEKLRKPAQNYRFFKSTNSLDMRPLKFKTCETDGFFPVKLTQLYRATPTTASMTNWRSVST